MLAACQKEETEAGSTIKLFAEGFGGDSSKMIVDHARTYWTTNDTVRINDNYFEVEVINHSSGREEVYIYTNSSRPLTYPLRALTPKGIYDGWITEDQIQVNLPAVYQYDQVVENGVGRQVLNAPMAAYATSGGELHFKHLTGALAVKITNNTGDQIRLERIRVQSSGAKLNGTFTVDFNDLTSPIGPVEASILDEQRVTMRFDKQEKVIGHGRAVYIQIPVPPVGTGNKFRIFVDYRHSGTDYVGRRCCYTFSKKQSTAGALNRAELGYVPVTAPEHGEGEGWYFFMDDDGYNIIRNIYDLRTFATINLASEIGTQKYIITKDIDATGITINPIEVGADITDFELDGGGHTISNLTINSYSSYCGLFRDLATNTTNPSHKYIHDLRLENTTLNISSLTKYAGPLAANTGTASSSTTTIENCKVYSTTYNLQNYNSQVDKAFGGLIGRHEKGGLVVDQCSVKNATFQYNNYSFSSRLYFGGLVGWNNVTFADQSTPRHEFTNCEFANVDDNRLSLQSSTAAFGGILGYSNSITLSPDKMHFSNLLIRKVYSTIAVKSILNDVYVGAVIGRTRDNCATDGFRPGVSFYSNSALDASMTIRAKCPGEKTYYTGGKYYWYTDDAHYNYESYGTSGWGAMQNGLVGNITDYEPTYTIGTLRQWMVFINME
ncbi:MAG: hypothetical protein SPL12_00100 [Bacteroidales bacterium]|nr:hypothetical protein [Bacteroidales bacterium]